MSAAGVKPSSRRRWLQFRIRSLLVIVTVASLALWYWQRPFQQEVVISERGRLPLPAETERLRYWNRSSNNPFFDDNPFVIYDTANPDVVTGYHCREVRTVLRVGWGQVLQDGLTLLYDRGGRQLGEEHWRQGRRHGAYWLKDAAGDPLIRGLFANGAADGVWTFWDTGGCRATEQIFTAGRRSGTWTWFVTIQGVEKKSSEMQFQDGKMISDREFIYAPSGELRQRIDRLLDANEKVNRVSVFGPSGNLKAESEYQDGRPIGQWGWWDADGGLIAKIDFEGGLPVRIDGQPVTQFFSPRVFQAPQWAEWKLDEEIVRLTASSCWQKLASRDLGFSCSL